MKKLNRLLTSTMVLLAFAAAVFAQGGPGAGGRRYDPKTETTVKGTVQDVLQQTGRHGWTGTHLVLKTDAGALEVHVGPSEFISQQQFSFAKGDAVEVVGSKATVSGKEVLLARKITKGGKTLVLRNAQGVPEWSGGGGRQN